MLVLLPPRREEEEVEESWRSLGLDSWDEAASMAMGDCWKPARGDLLL